MAKYCQKIFGWPKWAQYLPIATTAAHTSCWNESESIGLNTIVKTSG